MKRKIFLTLISLISLTINAQEVISSQGDSYSNANGSIDFTIGEVLIATITSGSNSLTQGFHQTNLTVLGIDDFDTNFQANVFPNPTSEILNIDILNFEGLNYLIYDIRGRQLLKASINNKITPVNINNLTNGLYLLVITGENNQKLKTYRIIKN